MEVRAVAKYVRVQPRKVRIIADEVRGKNAAYTTSLLRYHPSKSAQALRKVLISAMANAQENHNLSPETLRIATIMVDEGPRIKRIQARAMGRANRIVKKTSHITVVVEDAEPERAVKPHGTKAKARPTFGAPKKGAGKKKDSVDEAPPVTPGGEITDTSAETVTAAPAGENEGIQATPEEATPVTAADAPEEGAREPQGEGSETTAQAEGATGEAESSDDKGAQ
ncbi:MAG TPA: 50S ribosomal protein L22 [Fimbriimonadaceae bacterium]|nr:50S ribosomal protein L22 [Fimbriimonadaceae bacterium]